MERDVRTGTEVEDALREIVRGAARVTRADFGGVALVDERDRICHVVELASGRVERADIPPVLRDAELHRALIGDSRPIRVPRVADHPRVQGRAVDDRALGGFLAVPVREGARIWGSLYLAKSPAAVFDEGDEELVAPFAGAAGIVVENAFLRERRRSARQWLQATVDVTRSLLDAAGDEPLTVIGRAIRRVARADVVLVILPASAETVMVEAVIGDGVDHLAGYAFPRAGSVTDTVLRNGRATIVADVETYTGRSGALRMLSEAIDVGPMMFIPLSGQQGPRGVLAVGRRRGGTPFVPRELEPATVFANHATLALELADNRMEHHRLLMIAGRDRVAGELHDQILQGLFAMGASMQAIAGAVGDPYAERMRDLVAATDDMIERVREVLRQLGGLEAFYDEVSSPLSAE